MNSCALSLFMTSKTKKERKHPSFLKCLKIPTSWVQDQNCFPGKTYPVKGATHVVSTFGSPTLILAVADPAHLR